MNILRDEIEDIAERIKRKLFSKGPQVVYVRSNGVTGIYHPGDKRQENIDPLTLVGSYNRKAKVADIEDDLMARRREIAA